MKIKFKSLSAASILLAVLSFIFYRDNKVQKTDLNEIEFEPADDAKENVLDYFNTHKKATALDREYRMYPRDSVFRLRNVPLLLWYASNEMSENGGPRPGGFKPKESQAVIAYIESMLGDLTKPKVVSKLIKMLSKSEVEQTALIKDMIENGSLLLASAGYKSIKGDSLQEPPNVEDDSVSEDVVNGAKDILTGVRSIKEEEEEESTAEKITEVLKSVNPDTEEE